MIARRGLASWVLAGLLVALIGCGGPAGENGPAGDAPGTGSISSGAPGTADAPVVVASSRLGPITDQDIDRFVGRLGTAYRPDPKQTLAERYRHLARRLALEALLLEDGAGAGEADLEELDLQHQIYVYSQYYLTTLEPPAAITEDDLRAAFERRRDRFRRPETRRVSHIFLRYPDRGEQLPTWQRIEAIRRQIVDGRPFERMASEVSESETRHRDGLLGFVTRGTFPPDFDRVVFALEPGVPSEPVSTAEGAHLF